ncbi:MAG: hypothetical protein M1839_001560 [Geoglossum umbratile]|nr:MAG: hypothetical protein M1839_001560 [Geoglossum umbratile]
MSQAETRRYSWARAKQIGWGYHQSAEFGERIETSGSVPILIPLASRAYSALQQAENNVVLPASMSKLPKKAKGYQVRMRAIAAMRNPPHPKFLGRVTEVGQPFDNAMEAQQCCYACQGIMDYRVPAEFPQDDVVENVRDFCWRNRAGYPHACAEIEASLQCSNHWMKNGKHVRY